MAVTSTGRRTRWLAFTVMTLFLFVLGVSAAEAVTLRIGWTTSDSPVDPYAVTAREFAKALEELAPGQFDVRFFPSNQLGDEREMLEGLSLGTLDMGVITGTAIATMEPTFQLNDLPFLYSSAEQAHRVLDGPVGQQLMAQLEKHRILGLGFAEAGFRHSINNVRPIRTPADFQGVKFRVQPSDLFIDAFRAIGANPIPMAWGEVFTAVQQGTVDGLEIPLTVIAANRYSEVTRYLSLTGHAYNALGLLISRRTYDRLTPEQQAAVREAAAVTLPRQRRINAENQADILRQLESEGMVVNEVESVQAFRDAVSGVYAQYRTRIGADLVDQALEQVSSD